MTRDQLREAQQAIGYSNVDFAAAIGCTPRMLDYMLTGERGISKATALMALTVIERRIEELKAQIIVLESLNIKMK